jgi:hypothetical protein
METKHNSFIPMSPEALPQQRLNEVVGLPPKPDGFDVSVEYIESLGKQYPKGSPRKHTFVCSVEWAWSPANNRIDNYYLNPKPKHWLLWNNWVNDQVRPWTWHWDVLAYAPRIEADEFTLTTHMLLETWKYLAAHEFVDHYHWINNTGCLDVEDIQAIAREVW